MRVLMLFALLLSALPTIAQTRMYTIADTPVRIDSSTGGMVYTEVIRVDSAAAKTLYDRAKVFLVNAFSNEVVVNQMSNEGGSVVAGRGQIKLDMSVWKQALLGVGNAYYIEMGVEIRVKDGRYRYELNNIEMVNGRQRLNIDAAMRKNPVAAKRSLEKPFDERAYRKYMDEDKNPIMVFIRLMKAAMNPRTDKNDF